MKKHPFVWTLLISLLLHLLFLIFMFRIQGIHTGVHTQPDEVLQQDARQPIVFKIIESRDESAVRPDHADLMSDKQSIAKDMNPDAGGSDPYSETGVAFESLPQPKQNQEARPQEHEAAEPLQNDRDSRDLPDGGYQVYQKKSGKKFDRKMLVGAPESGQEQARPAFQQTQGSAEDFGGISFNTYDWEYAPYLLMLKKRIQKNIFPPPAFTRLGFGGINCLRFRIMPDGALVGPFLVEVKGEEALVETSKKAVQISAPFPPLPDDFPENFLEVTAQFSYSTYSMNQ